MAKFTHSFTMELSKTIELPNGKNKQEKIAEVQVPYPTLGDFGIQAEQAVWRPEDLKDDPKRVVGAPAFSNGVPVYKDDRADWLQQAIVKAVAASSRNKFKDGELKPGLSLAEDFETLTAPTSRTGEALAIRREAKQSFEAFLGARGKKQVTVQQLSTLFYNSASTLGSAGTKYVNALAQYSADWIDSLTEEQKSRFSPKIAELQESINAASARDELDEDLADVKAA